MNYQLISWLIVITCVLLLFVSKLTLPHIVRPDIFFGVRLPEQLANAPELLELKQAYVKNYWFVCGIYIVLFCLSLYKIPGNAVFIGGIIIFFILSTWLYYLTHQRVKQIKDAFGDTVHQRQIVIVDTAFRSDKSGKIVPAGAWFILPISIIALNVIVGYMVYDDLPIVVATHWNAQGMIDGGVFKTYGVLYFFPVIELFVTALAFFLYKVVSLAKQDLNAASPEESKEKSRLFRYRWGANIIFLNAVILAVLSVYNAYILQVIPVNMAVLLYAQPVLLVLILLDMLLMTVWTGQGGARVHLQVIPPSSLEASGLDDDKYWLGGLFYFNQRDPALFVEKRFGIAWGLNYGNIKAYLLIVSLIASVFLLNLLIDMMLVY